MTAKIVSFGSEPCFQGWHLGNTLVILENHRKKKKTTLSIFNLLFLAGYLMFTFVMCSNQTTRIH